MNTKTVKYDDLPNLVNLISGLVASGHYTVPGTYPNSIPELKLAVTTLDKKETQAHGSYTAMAVLHAESLLSDAKKILGV
jgi:hypothetical protein